MLKIQLHPQQSPVALVTLPITQVRSVYLTISLQRAQFPKPKTGKDHLHFNHLFTLTRSAALTAAAPSWRTHTSLWTTQGLQHRAKTPVSKQGAGLLLPQSFKVISLARRETPLNWKCGAVLGEASYFLHPHLQTLPAQPFGPSCKAQQRIDPTEHSPPPHLCPTVNLHPDDPLYHVNSPKLALARGRRCWQAAAQVGDLQKATRHTSFGGAGKSHL